MNAAVERLLRRRAIVDRLIWQARYPVIAEQLPKMRAQAAFDASVQDLRVRDRQLAERMAARFLGIRWSESELRASWGDR